MNAEDIKMCDIETYIYRGDNHSRVTVKFKQNSITISAMMKCDRTLIAEEKAKNKILTYLGFSKTQIEATNYD